MGVWIVTMRVVGMGLVWVMGMRCVGMRLVWVMGVRVVRAAKRRVDPSSFRSACEGIREISDAFDTGYALVGVVGMRVVRVAQ